MAAERAVCGRPRSARGERVRGRRRRPRRSSLAGLSRPRVARWGTGERLPTNEAQRGLEVGGAGGTDAGGQQLQPLLPVCCDAVVKPVATDPRGRQVVLAVRRRSLASVATCSPRCCGCCGHRRLRARWPPPSPRCPALGAALSSRRPRSVAASSSAPAARVRLPLPPDPAPAPAALTSAAHQRRHTGPLQRLARPPPRTCRRRLRPREAGGAGPVPRSVGSCRDGMASASNAAGSGGRVAVPSRSMMCR